MLGHPLHHPVERAAQLARLDHVHEQRREDALLLLERLGQRKALLDVLVEAQVSLAGLGPVGATAKDVDRLEDGDACGEHRAHLAAKKGDLLESDALGPVGIFPDFLQLQAVEAAVLQLPESRVAALRLNNAPKDFAVCVSGNIFETLQNGGLLWVKFGQESFPAFRTF